jgi:hypothetical protein
MIKILQTSALVLFALSFAHSQVKINEVMANNQGTLKSSLVQNHDWIELYNTGNEEVDLSGMGISDNATVRHTFGTNAPKIPSKGFLVLLASGNTSLGTRHLNFGLNHEGETLRLFSASGKVLDSFEYPELRKNISYGRIKDGAKRLRFYADPSPETSNDEQDAIKKVTRTPKFSKKGGYYTSSFGLKISRFLSNADIYYTMDGSEPNLADTIASKYEFKRNYQENPGDPAVNQKFTDSKQSFLYKNKINLSAEMLGGNRYSLIPTTFARSASYLPSSNVPKAQVIRAVAVKKGRLPSEVVTNTYFFESSRKSPYTFPIVSLSFNPDDLFDYERGMYVAGSSFDAFRRTSFETTGLCTPGNYANRESFWDREASFEFFENSSQKICQNITSRIHGGCSRSFPYKSMKLFSNDAFEKYDLIRKNKTKNQLSIILRNSGNDYNKTLFKDAFIHQLMKPLHIPIQEFRPSVVYINGEYWGIHNLRDRVDNDYLNKVYGVDKSNVDMIKIVFDGPEEVEYGDGEAYTNLKSFFLSNNFADAANFEKAQALMDMDNFIDYQIAEIFVGNIDWPQNNVRLWRVKTEKANKAPNDGKWRWVFFDADRSLGETVNVASNNLSDAITRPENFIFTRLLQNQSFKVKFVARFRELLDSTFKYENSSKMYLEIKKMYEPEIDAHLKRWRIISSKQQWEQNCQDVLDYLKFRPDIMKKQLAERFGLLLNEVQILNPMSAEIEIDQEMERASTSKYLETNHLLKIKPRASENSKFSHWLIGGKVFYETEMQVKIETDTTIVAIFDKKSSETEMPETKVEAENYVITKGLSPNDDGQNEHLELQLLNELEELESFEVFDKNGVRKNLTVRKNPDSSKIEIHFINKSELNRGTLFFAMKLKGNPKIHIDFITVAY